MRTTLAAILLIAGCNRPVAHPIAFSATDLASTEAWAKSRLDDSDRHAANPLRHESAADTFDKEAGQHLGKRIEWTTTVERIMANRITVFPSDRVAHGFKYGAGNRPRFVLAFHEKQRPANPEFEGPLDPDPFDEIIPPPAKGSRTMFLRVGANLDKETLFRLSPGDRVTLSATIKELRFSAGRGMFCTLEGATVVKK